MVSSAVTPAATAVAVTLPCAAADRAIARCARTQTPVSTALGRAHLRPDPAITPPPNSCRPTGILRAAGDT
ncbi:hypothetical protein [Actinoplanes awajinensis]|uniref:hypothetical protein n=1 Tax=Actinoplanes awajinensis TaxID=135946 RepID=UPI001E41431C|nr:hypothetical protein [Actinoplanes awajinensis]